MLRCPCPAAVRPDTLVQAFGCALPLLEIGESNCRCIVVTR
jgi:hypothetical protein